MINLKKKIKF